MGAFLGPLLALLFMFWWADDIKAVLWVAVAPATFAAGAGFALLAATGLVFYRPRNIPRVQ